MYYHPNQNRDDNNAHIQQKAVSDRLSSSHTNHKITSVACVCSILYKGTTRYPASPCCASYLGQALCCRQEAASESAARHSSEVVLAGITSRPLP